MDILEFRNIKNQLLKLYSLIDSIEDNNEMENLAKNYLALQDKLLSEDLSNIPFEEWEGLTLVSEDLLDLSKTHANIDFSLLKDIEFERINLDGCNVRGLQVLRYDESTFDEEFKKNHSEYFLDETFPENIKKLYYEKKLELFDIVDYPSLRKYVYKESFKEAFDTPSNELIKRIGFDNAIRMLDEYPEFIKMITYRFNRDSLLSEFVFSDEIKNENINSYLDAKRYVYEQYIYNLKNSYSFKSTNLNLETLPKDMIEQFPNVFLNSNEFPQNLYESYYEGTLSIKDIRDNKDILKNKDIDIGTRKSLAIKGINKVFGDIWGFLDKIPEKYDSLFERFFSKINYNNEKLEEISKLNLEEIIREAIRTDLSNVHVQHSYNDLYDFLQYLPIEEVISNIEIRNFINKCGFLNIVNFNKKYNYILDFINSSIFGNYEDTFLSFLAQYINIIENIDINNLEDLTNAFEKIIHEIRISDNYRAKSLINDIKEELSEIYPKQFIDYKLLNKLLVGVEEKQKEKLIDNLERGFNGNIETLFNVLSSKPELSQVLYNKDLIIKEEQLKLLYESLDNEKFLNLCSKYGNALLQITNTLNYKDILAAMDSDDFESIINEYIYNIITLGNQRKFDIRILPESFKKEHPELFLSEDAPEDLKKTFYEKNYIGKDLLLMDAEDIQKHPEWVKYLINIDLSKCLKPLFVSINSKQTNFYEFLKMKFSQEEILDFILKYGKILLNCHVFNLNTDSGKEELYNSIISSIRFNIGTFEIMYDDKILPIEFQKKYSELFLSEDAPYELKDLFYKQKLKPSSIKNHSNWIKYIENKALNTGFDSLSRNFINNCFLSFLDISQIFDLFNKYGDYLLVSSLSLKENARINNNDSKDLFEVADDMLKKEIIESIITNKCNYDESAMNFIKDDYPDLFLDINAPEELKTCFYNYTSKTPISFKLLKEHREFLPFLEGKNIILSFKKAQMNENSVTKFFEKYKEDAIKIGIKNPESVTQMLKDGQHEILFKWYDKLHFIPHYVVMREFPFDEIDKFISSAKKWSTLMKIERYNVNEDAKAALLKASMCFGVFDNDTEGFNKIIHLFTDIPKEITKEDIEKINNYIKDAPDEKKSTLLEQLSVLESVYEQKGESYILKINSQQNKSIVKTIRSLMESANLDKILTTDKAHKLFGGFDMSYNPTFRDFILENMDKILSSDEYISYISSMQKQWNKIKAMNSNRVLTLDLAMSFIKINKYENVEIGNESLAEVCSMAGYSQKSFDILQRIYNYGSSRVTSSIPRIYNETNEYTYEILRLDDPLAVAIGTLTDCCQELGNAAETCVEHSMVSKHGRIFVIKDKEGNIVAQSWVWRNKNIVCFDNIEVPDKAFTRAHKTGVTNINLTDKIYAIYERAAQELIEKDNIEYKRLLDEGKITREEYDALKLAKVTVGLGYNDIAKSLERNAVLEKSDIATPLDFNPPVALNHGLYTSDSKTQYIISGQKDVVDSNFETKALYSDEFVILDDLNISEKDIISLEKMEYAMNDENYYGKFQINDKENLVSKIAINYGLNPKTTKIIKNANFAIIYDELPDEIIIGDILFDSNLKDKGFNIDITDKVAMQIRNAFIQIGLNKKKFNINSLDKKQLEMCNRALNIEEELDLERGLSHGTR